MYITYLLVVVADTSIGWNLFFQCHRWYSYSIIHPYAHIMCPEWDDIVLVFIKTKELHTLHFLFIFLFLGFLHLYFSLNEWQLNDLNK